MKPKTHKIACFFLAFVVLLSTSSFKVDSHFCGENLVNISVFSQAEGCGMEMAKNSIDKPLNLHNSCCKDTTISIEGNTVLQQEIQKMNLPQVYFLIAFASSFTNTLDQLNTPINHIYKPPLVKNDYTVLFQNFRI